MAACFDSNSDSDASSDDVSLPFFKKVGRFHKSLLVPPVHFTPSSLTPESKLKSQPKTSIVSKDFENIPSRVSEDSSEDYITGDTPPAPKRHMTKQKGAQDLKEVGKSVVKLHDIMKHNLTSTKVVGRGKEVLHDIMKHPRMKSKKVLDYDFTRPKKLPLPSLKGKVISKRECLPRIPESHSSEESDWNVEPLGVLKEKKRLSEKDVEFLGSPIDTQGEDESQDEDDFRGQDYKDQFSQKSISAFQKQLQARQRRHTLEDLQQLRSMSPVDISSSDSEERHDPIFISGLTSAILGRRNDSFVADSQFGTHSGRKVVESKSRYGETSFRSGGTEKLRGVGCSSVNVVQDVEEIEDSSSRSDDELPPRKVARLTRRKMVEVKLEKDDIETTRRKYCCQNTCLRKLGYKSIREAREKYFRLNSQDRPLSLQWLVRKSEIGIEDDSESKKDSLRHDRAYKVLDVLVCRKAFKAVFCVGNHMLSRLSKLKNDNLQYHKPVGAPITHTSYVVISWMKTFFDTHCESLPNKEVVHLPDNYSKLEVYNVYKSSFVNLDTSCNITYRRWCKLWNIHFPLVKIPQVNRFSVCADCEEFKSIREKAVTTEDRGEFKYDFFSIIFVHF